MWFTETSANQVGRITPAGQITEFPISTAGSQPGAITAGPDGALWFVQPGVNDVGRITTAGVVSEVPITVAGSSCAAGSGPVGIASGSNGDLWVTEDRNSPGEIAEIDPNGDGVTQNCLAYAAPDAIASGGDGAMWFTYGMDDVGRITTAGSSSSIPTVQASTALMPIISGPDGNLWIGITGSPALLERLTTTDVAKGFDLPAGSTASTERIASGPDGQIWMAGGGGLTSITTSGSVSSFSGIYPPGDTIAGLAAGPGDTLWLTDSTNSTIYRVSLGTPPTATPTIGATLNAVSNVADTGATVSGVISATGGTAAQGVTYQFDYGTTTAYGSSTAAAAATATAAGTQVSATLSGLLPFTTYHYKLVASGCSPSTCSASTGDQSFTTGVTLTPVFDQSVVIAGISGKILVKLKGTHKFVRVSSPELIPLGAEINARHGTVLIDSATQAGTQAGTQAVASGQFAGGLFYVQQPPGAPTTVIDLASSFAACRAKAHHTRHASMARASKKSVSHKVVNQVFGNAHGQYTTQGHYAAAADEGTSWQVADRCDGTYVAVSVGQVNVTNLVTQATFALSAGQHYLAAAR